METRKVLTVVYAIHDFQAENPDELSFSAGEAIDVIEKDDLYGDGWWQGRNTKGQYGLFPQAYTLAASPALPPQSSSKSTPQLTMTETLSEVQHAIDQLHHPSSSSTSLPPSQTSSHPIDHHADSAPPRTLDHSEDGDETNDRDPSFHVHSNPAKARALLAKKAQADSNNNHSIVMERLKSASNKLYSHHRPSVNSLISVPGIGEIELSEESGGDDDPDEDSSNHSNQLKNGISAHRSRSSTVAGRDQRPSDHSSNRRSSLTRPSSPKLASQRSSDSSRQAPFKAGPFSAAAMALGLTRSPKDQNSSKPATSPFEKGHRAQLPSSSSLLSDIGLDLREHFNFTSAPVASTLRMSRQSSQFTNQSPTPNLRTAQSNSAIPSNEDQPISPQEFLSEAAVATGPSPRSQENLNAASTIHPRRASNCSTGSGVFSSQQLSHPPNPSQTANQDTKTSVSTADSSSVKGSRSRSSSRVEQFVSVEDQASPATSTFPSSAGARQGGSLSSSHSKSYRPIGFGSLSYVSPDQWSVGEVIEWAKVKGFDEFTISKFTEHEITGDVLIELDVNALKEIDLTAFGRRVRVMKAIDELKRHKHIQKPSGSISPHSDIINSIDSSLQQTNLSNPRKELGSNHVSRPSFHAKQDFSHLAYRQTYQPTAELSDREEEEVVHQSARTSSSKFSYLQNHSKRPSDASALSFHRQPQNDNGHSSREELQGSSADPSPVLDRPSSSTGRPRLATFSNHDRSQQNHSFTRSKSPNPGRSRCSSWTPATESQERKSAEVARPVAELDGPITLQASDMDTQEKPKKVKKKKIPSSKPPGTAQSTKNKKASFDSPENVITSPVSPQKSQDSANAKSRTSFLGNLRAVRKPPPKFASHAPDSAPATTHAENNDGRPGSSAGFQSSINGRHGRSLFNFGHEKVQGQPQHQIQHLKPLADSKNLISSPMLLEERETEDLEIKKEGETRTALERIGTPDHVGWMRKKGEKYPTWKLRYFVLKGSNLYYLKSQNEIRIKGLIKLSGFKVVMDADVHPGRYGFRIIHDNGSTHLFSADDSKLLRDWMKAMMKATIDRDWVAPVISSCNIRTISIREAQKMFPPPRPPSPQSRARLQKARLAANGDMLNEKDAAVLMGMQNLQASSGQLYSSHPSVSSSTQASPEQGSSRPRRSMHRPSGENLEDSFKLTSKDQEVLDWINRKISHTCATEAKDYSRSIRNGMVLVRLIESLTRTSSGLSDEHFLQVDHLLESDPHSSIIQRDEDFDVYFTIFDYFNNRKIPLEGYSLNDLISGDPFKTRDFIMRIYNKFKDFNA